MADARRDNWSVAIFSSREQPQALMSSVVAAVVACGKRDAVIDVVINGNALLAGEIAKRVEARAAGEGNIAIRVWFLALGDKPHAWNEYVHRIWPGAQVAFFVDGYASVRPDAFELLRDGLASHPSALLASGVPTVGRSARKLRAAMANGGIHGNMFAIRGSAMHAIRQCGFRLPLGMYRTDGTILSALCFGLDPKRHEWDWNRVFVHPEATWSFRPLSWSRPADWRTQLRRTLRQSEGHLITRALRAHLAQERRSPAELPRTASDLVLAWTARHRGEALVSILKDPLGLVALRRLRRPRDWSKAAVEPSLLLVRGAIPHAGPTAATA